MKIIGSMAAKIMARFLFSGEEFGRGG